MKFKLFVLISLLFVSILLGARPQQELVKVIVAPDHYNWQYEVGEKVKFTITVLRAGNRVPNVEVLWEIKPEKMQTLKTKTEVLKSGSITIDGGTMKEPGFLRCWATATVDGREYKSYATAGFAPLDIVPTTTLPKDFVEFWEQEKQKAAKIPMDPIVTLIPERCTSKVNVYHVNLQNEKKDSRLYGILCVPKTEGKVPAILQVPGAGVGAHQGEPELAGKGVISFAIGIHGIPVNIEGDVYYNLRSAALGNYWFYNLDDKDRYYYKRVYLGCVRAIDFIYSLPEFDGENLAVFGGSQGGALSIVTAGLDSRVKCLAAFVPALCDLTGYLYGRAGGWPHMFNEDNKVFNVKEDKIETSKYYDVVNFAKQLKVPGWYSWGYNDNVCPPTSMYSAYNVITAPKELLLALDTGHWVFPEQEEASQKWLFKMLGVE